MTDRALDLLERCATSLESMADTNLKHYELFRDQATHHASVEVKAEERAKVLLETILARAAETTEQHEIGMAMIGARAPDVIPPELNRAQRRRRR